MPEIKGSIDIDRPVEDVFSYLSDPKNNVEWESGVVEMELTSEGPVGVGSKGRRVENFMGTDEGTWEITEYEENKTLAMTFESPRFSGEGSWRLESTGGATRLAYRFRGDPKSSLFRLIMPLLMPMARRQIRRDYGKLKQILEARA